MLQGLSEGNNTTNNTLFNEGGPNEPKVYQPWGHQGEQCKYNKHANSSYFHLNK